jgi:hypothetical protein
MCSSIKKDKGEFLYCNVMSVCACVRTCSSTTILNIGAPFVFHCETLSD